MLYVCKVGQEEHGANDAQQEKLDMAHDGNSEVHSNPGSMRLQELFRVSHASEVCIDVC